MVKGDLIIKFDHSKPARIGILPRYAKNESTIKWFELPTCYAFHNGEKNDMAYFLFFHCLKFYLVLLITCHYVYAVLISWILTFVIAFTVNAWEEGDEVVLYTCRLPEVDLEMAAGPLRTEFKVFQNEL